MKKKEAIEELVRFDTYEALSDYCCPFSKNLAKGISDGQRMVLLESIARFYRQRLDEVNEVLGYPKTMLVNVSDSPSFWGRCSGLYGIIELDVCLICAPPLALTSVIIHELTHYEQSDHKKSFYDCLVRNIGKMGLSGKLYGYKVSKKGRNPETLQEYFADIEKHQEEIRKLFRLPLRKKSLYPPIPHGSLPDFFSYQEFVRFCVPYYKVLPRITGLLDRIKLLSYAERFYLEIVREQADVLGIYINKVYVISGKWELEEGSLGLPFQLIGLEEAVFRQLMVSVLTYFQPSSGDFYACFRDNMKRLGMEETASASFFLLDRWYNGWGNCFDASGRKRMEFLFSEVIEVPEPKQLALF